MMIQPKLYPFPLPLVTNRQSKQASALATNGVQMRSNSTNAHKHSTGHSRKLPIPTSQPNKTCFSHTQLHSGSCWIGVARFLSCGNNVSAKITITRYKSFIYIFRVLLPLLACCVWNSDGKTEITVGIDSA